MSEFLIQVVVWPWPHFARAHPLLQVEVGVVIVCAIVVEKHVAGIVAVVVVVMVAVVVVIAVEILRRFKSLSDPGLILPGLTQFASRCRNCVSRCPALASFCQGLPTLQVDVGVVTLCLYVVAWPWLRLSRAHPLCKSNSEL